jgi:hypothetical protein
MAWKTEITSAATKVLREATKTGWVDSDHELEVAELERAKLVYDGAVTGAGYQRAKQR